VRVEPADKVVYAAMSAKRSAVILADFRLQAIALPLPAHR
jgi:hypothetical protein